MTAPADQFDPFFLREWLLNERRLGLPIWATPPSALRPPAAANAGSSRAVAPITRSPLPVAPALKPPVRPAPPARPAADKGAERPDFSAARAAVRPAGAPAGPLATGLELLVDDPNLPPLNTRDLPVAEAAAELEKLNASFVRACRKCRLNEHRTQTVFGVGHARPELVFVGEGPGADEDAQGEPFVGRAGQLLTRMIAAMTLTREQVYICNVVKCRPPGNRTPTEDEMAACAPFLLRQLAILRPKVIVTLGRPATQTLLMTRVPISRLRGQWQEFPPPALAAWGVPRMKLMPTYHPAYLLRNPPAKADTWEDLKQVMAELGLKAPGK